MTTEISQNEQDAVRKKMLRGGVFMSLSPVASLILGLIVLWMIQSYISAEQYGLFEWFNVLSSFFITILPFRLPSAFGRYIAYSSGQDEVDTIDSLITSSTVMTLLLVPVSGLVAFLITPIVFSSLGLGTQYLLIDGIIFTFGVMSINLSAFTTSVATGQREFKNLGIAKLIANVASQCTVVVLIPLNWGISALLMKSVILGLITTIFLYFTVKNIWSLKGSRYPLKPLIKYAYPAIISFLFAYILNEILIRVIFQQYASMGFTEELGLYGFAVRIVTFINALSLGYYSILGSYYSQALGRSPKDLNEVFQWTVRMSFFLFTPLFVVCLVVAPSVFLIVFPVYYWAYKYFVILIIQLIFLLFVRPLHAVLSAAAKTQHILVTSILGALGSGALMVLAFSFGLQMVVLAYISVSVFVVFFSIIFVRKTVPEINLRVKKVGPISVVALSSLVPAVIIHYMRLEPPYEFVINALVFLLIYVAGARFLRLITISEIRKATVFLPTKLVSPFAKFLILIFVRREKEARTEEVIIQT